MGRVNSSAQASQTVLSFTSMNPLGRFNLQIGVTRIDGYCFALPILIMMLSFVPASRLCSLLRGHTCVCFSSFFFLQPAERQLRKVNASRHRAARFEHEDGLRPRDQIVPHEMHNDGLKNMMILQGHPRDRTCRPRRHHQSAATSQAARADERATR